MRHCHEEYGKKNMPTHKLKRKNLLCRLAIFFNRLGDKADPSRNLDEAKKAELKKAADKMYTDMEKTNKRLGLPPLDAKNPYRFW